MAGLEILKPILGEELYTSFLEKMGDAKDVHLINASDGSYVPKAKFDTEIAAKKQYLSQVEELGRDKAALDEEISKLRQQLKTADEESARQKKDAERSTEKITKLQQQVEKLNGDLETRSREVKEAEGYKGEVERLTAVVADRDKAIDSIRKQGKLSGMLQKMGARNPDVLIRMLDLDEIHEENGKMQGLEEQVTRLKTSDPYLFTDRPAPKGGVDAGDPGARHLSAEDTVNRQVNLEIRRAAGYNV